MVRVKILISVLLVFATAIVCAQTRKDTLNAHFANPNVSDSMKAVHVISYSYSFPTPPFDEAVYFIDRAYQLCVKSGVKDLPQKLLARKIDFYTANGKGLEAFNICQEMLKLGQSLDDNFIIAQSYRNRGNIFRSYEMMDKAIREQRTALGYYKLLNNGTYLSEAEYLLGWYEFNNREYDSSLKHLQYSYRNALKAGLEYNTLGEYSGWVGNSYGAVKKYDSAVYYRRLSMNYFAKKNDRYGVADCYRYLGNIYRNMKNYDSAMACYKSAYTIFNEIKTPERKWLVEYFIAETHSALKNYKASAMQLNSLLDTATGTTDLLSMMLGNGLGARVYEQTGEYKKAINCYKKYALYKDSIDQANKTGAVTELDAKLKFEQEEAAYKLEQAKKDADAARDKERQALVRNIFIGASVIMALFLFVVYRNFRQKQKANLLLQKQKEEIELQKKEIQDSINYAQNIQAAVLPDMNEIAKHFKEMFVLYKPKDVVSGDFFWFHTAKLHSQSDVVLLAAADCTGHGVPGAFMSMIGSYELNNSVLEKGLLQPSEILSEINYSLKRRLKQNEDSTRNRDGMDIALCAFDMKNMHLQYSGANRPLYIVRNEQLLEFRPTKAAIGGITEDEKVFENNNIPLEQGDCVYMYTDGYSDQFGGKKNKKLTTKNFKTVLQSFAKKTMREQHESLDEYFSDWKGNYEQLDDILVIGVKI